ncbi:MAG: hypothetical protein HWN67_01315 [Candidatus Helarchaeota archaeon]|nr:hypothetical protein [Candidatus Helarchaeota archaeon]
MVLAFLELVFAIPIFTYYIIHYLKYRAMHAGYLTLFTFCVGAGIFWESSRLFLAFSYHIFYEVLDGFFFLLKSFSAFLGAFVLLELAIKIINKSGLGSKYYNIIRIVYIMIVPLITLFIFYTNIRIGPDGLGLYEYQVNQVMVPLFYIFYLPVAIFMFLEIRKIQALIKNKKTIKIYNLFIIFLVLAVFDRFFAINYTYYYGNSVPAIFSNFCLKLIYTISIFILLFKFGNFIEFIGVYFDIKTIYLINNKGMTIYTYNFQYGGKDLITSSRDLVLGGFMYAISRGLKHIIEATGELETIKIGNKSVIFTQGNYLFGALFATESTPILKDKLVLFVKNVEDKYKTIFEQEKGEYLIIMKSPEHNLDEIVWEIFR